MIWCSRPLSRHSFWLVQGSFQLRHSLLSPKCASQNPAKQIFSALWWLKKAEVLLGRGICFPGIGVGWWSLLCLPGQLLLPGGGPHPGLILSPWQPAFLPAGGSRLLVSPSLLTRAGLLLLAWSALAHLEGPSVCVWGWVDMSQP